jgi:hypothetical protein
VRRGLLETLLSCHLLEELGNDPLARLQEPLARLQEPLARLQEPLARLQELCPQGRQKWGVESACG